MLKKIIGLLLLIFSFLLAGCNRPGTPPSEAPELVAPRDMDAVDTAFPTFQWREVPGAEAYTLEVEPLESGAPVVEVADGLSHTLTHGLEVGKRYRWTVRASNSAGFGPASEVRIVGILRAVRPGPPELINVGGDAPADGDIYTGGMSSEFHWRARSPVLEFLNENCFFSDECEGDDGILYQGDYYQFQIHRAGELIYEDFIGAGPGEYKRFDPRWLSLAESDAARSDVNLECGATYQWRVRHHRIPDEILLDDDDEAPWYQELASLSQHLVSPWSETGTFRTPSRPELAPVLLSPPDGAAIRGGRLDWQDMPEDESISYQLEVAYSPRTLGPRARYADSESGRMMVDPGPADITGFVFWDLRRGQRHYWRVRAYRGVENCHGPWSEQWYFIWNAPSQIGGPGLPPPSAVCEDPPCATPTITPYPTWTPIPVGPLQVEADLVVEQPASCRIGPGTVYPIKSYFEEGDALVATGADPSEGWWYVHPTDSEELCWISDQLVSPLDELPAVPVLTPRPTPTWTPPPPTEAPSTGGDVLGCVTGYQNGVPICTAPCPNPNQYPETCSP